MNRFQRWMMVIALLGAAAWSLKTLRAAEPRVAVWLGGDVHLGTRRGNLLAPLAPLLAGAAGIINLEGPVLERLPQGRGLRLHNHPASVAELAAAGVRVVSVANNHALDGGEAGRAKTLKQLHALKLLPAGLALLEARGLRIVVSSHDLSQGLPGRLAIDLTAAAAKGDVLITTFHTTGPASYLPGKTLKEAVAIAVSSGSRVIAAHGSHMVGPVERRGSSVIAWGLGNLLFDCECTRERDGLVLRVELEGRRVARVEVIPVDAGLLGEAARPAHNPALVLDLLEAIGSQGLMREGDRAYLRMAGADL